MRTGPNFLASPEPQFPSLQVADSPADFTGLWRLMWINARRAHRKALRKCPSLFLSNRLCNSNYCHFYMRSPSAKPFFMSNSQGPLEDAIVIILVLCSSAWPASPLLHSPLELCPTFLTVCCFQLCIVVDMRPDLSLSHLNTCMDNGVITDGTDV